ncbi:hypothetical protein [Beijerinckia sp. L45]|uniref:hypothetical protein n=1 Tax=Beijerinckia sp. L45 TaxID=1641855 RepID=UPI00131A8CC4|nr:hypothetical protein [Beijerinckia sp. L45]
MADRPIIFSAAMIRALLAGRKTQTRRILRYQPEYTPTRLWHVRDAHGGCFYNTIAEVEREAVAYIPYAVGDRLYVREAWAPLDALTHNDPGSTALINRGFYRADESTVDGEISRWRPSIHMPRWASRLTLDVTDVRVQRLQDISEEDAKAEGCKTIRDHCHVFEGTAYDRSGLCHSSAVTAFGCFWDELHGPDAWSANPWVAAITFTVRAGNIDVLQERAAA